MKTTLAFLFSLMILMSLAVAQDRAVMEPPVIQSDPDVVKFSVRFSSLSPAQDYRVGVGSVGPGLSKVQLELTSDGSPVQAEVVEFKQGYTSSWWGVDELSARGFQIQGNLIPPKDAVLSLRVTVPKPDADKVGKLYVFVARQYAGSVWYVEDGTELTREFW